MKEGFTTPPKHINFNAKKLFGDVGQIIDGSMGIYPKERKPELQTDI